MKPRFRLSDYLTRWSVLGGLAAGALLFLALVALIWTLRPKAGIAALAASTPDVTVIPAPTLTLPPAIPTALPAVSPTPKPELNATTIVIGGYAQITGTGGDGLRLREKPGTSGKQLFLGMDNEVFQVRDGPVDADGYTWWYLEAPYDKNRSGWAASRYLGVVTAPQ